MRVEKYVKITPSSIFLNGKPFTVNADDRQMLSGLYHTLGLEYPKFFKMDMQCKLGFIASELLLAEDNCRFIPRDDRSVLIFSKCGSYCNDCNYQKTITEGNYFPSPSLFVYTLPNVVTGEICIRNKYYGDSTSFVLSQFDARNIMEILMASSADKSQTSVLCGWVDCRSEEDFDAMMMLLSDRGEELNKNTLITIFENGTIDRRPQEPNH